MVRGPPVPLYYCVMIVNIPKYDVEVCEPYIMFMSDSFLVNKNKTRLRYLEQILSDSKKSWSPGSP